jgi:hypothetical protein
MSRGLGAAMAGGNPGRLATEDRERAEDDFYPTPRAVTEALARRYAHALATRIVWEPCAGDGAMVDVLRPYVVHPGAGGLILPTDIAPRRIDVAPVDLFDPRVDAAQHFRERVECVVTNPPFNLAVRIIERILAPGFLPKLNFLALVLKGSFWHAKTRLPLFERVPPYAVHPLTWRPDFHALGRPTMEVMWCVWVPGLLTTTEYIPLREAMKAKAA